MIQMWLQLAVCSRKGHVVWPEGSANPLCYRCGKWLPGTKAKALERPRL